MTQVKEGFLAMRRFFFLVSRLKKFGGIKQNPKNKVIQKYAIQESIP
jgi:hypothetical protein